MPTVIPQTVILRSATLPCPPEEAFRWFTERERLEAWLAPAATVEPRVGGRYELFWNPEDRAHDSTLGCRVTALVPAQLLAFDWRGATAHEPFMDGADPATHVSVSFMPTAEGTVVHLLHSGWRSTPEWIQARLWFERAWEMAFGELIAAVSAVSAGTRG